jgi:hypothetical protein
MNAGHSEFGESPGVYLGMADHVSIPMMQTCGFLIKRGLVLQEEPVNYTIPDRNEFVQLQGAA